MSIRNKVNYVLRRVFAVFLAVYASCSTGFTETRSAEYIVKINDIPIYSDSANRVLRGAKEQRKNVYAYDNVNNKKILLSTIEIEENMDITIVGKNYLMETVSKLYNSYNGEDEITSDIDVIYEDGNRKCMCLVENGIDMHLCVDKKSRVALSISWANVD